ncbi:MAG: fibronectin type III domain-containing protein [bacterium]
MDSGLPALAGLDDPGRESSVIGPGWHVVDIAADMLPGGSGGTPVGDHLYMDASSAVAYAIWGAGSFTESQHPNSLLIDVAEGGSEYYLAYSDYGSARWVSIGPFSGDQQLEYPAGPEIKSPLGWHYMALIVPAGSSLQLNSVLLGVDDSELGIVPVSNLSQSGGNASIQFQWADIPSLAEPFFAGYIVQRSPVDGSDWQDLTLQPQIDNYFIDLDVTTDTPYLYRVNCLDAAGTVVFGAQHEFSTMPGDYGPVAVLQGPGASFDGPYTASFDMSASFHPDGDPIVQYRFEFGSGIDPVEQSSPVLEIELQPGNYIVRGTCWSDSDGNDSPDQMSAPDFTPITILPVWQENSRLLYAREGKVRRTINLHTVANPADDSVTTFGWEGYVGGVFAMTTRKTGEISYDFISNSRQTHAWLSEPAPYDGGWAFIGAMTAPGYAGRRYRIITFSNGKLNYMPDFEMDVFRIERPMLVTDGSGNLNLFYWDATSTNNNRIRRLDFGTGNTTDVLQQIGPGYSYDVEFNNALDLFEITYYDEGLHWARYDGSSIVDTAFIADVNPFNSLIDMEVNPATDRPEIVYHKGGQFWTALNADNDTWKPVENLYNDFQAENLSIGFRDGRTFVGIVAFTGETWIVQRDNDAWETWSTMEEKVYPHDFRLLEYPGEDGLLCIGRDYDGRTFVTQLFEDDTQLRWGYMPGTWGPGNSLQTASASDGLHVMQVTAVPGPQYLHLVSTDSVTWNEAEVVATFPEKVDLGTDSAGDLYITWQALDCKLMKWNGSGYDFVDNVAVDSSGFSYISDEGPLRVGGTITSGDQYGVYTESGGSQILTVARQPVLEGSIAAPGELIRALVYYEHGSPTQTSLGYLDPANGSIQHVSDLLRNDLDSSTEGRLVDGTTFTEPGTMATSSAWHVTNGPAEFPLRVVLKSDGSISTHELAFNYPANAPEDSVFVSSACQAWGSTFVGLTADNLGRIQHLEWNKGNGFARLQVPEVEGPLSRPELLIGQDGRWHIIYRDYLADELRIISTI